MSQKPYKKYNIKYQPGFQVSRQIPEANKKKSIAHRVKNIFWKMSHEKITVMFIPHNEHKMLHFHISSITMLFMASLFLLTVTTSLYTMVIHSKVEDQASVLAKENRHSHLRLLQIKNQVLDTKTVVEKLKGSTLSSVSAVTGMEKNLDELFHDNYSLLFIDENDKIQDLQLRQLSQLQRDVYLVSGQTKSITEFLVERREVNNNTPGNWPTWGYITSLYGYRRDPFTYQKRFHAALDIAGEKNTSVHATAAGQVVRATYSKGLGHFVEIQHKYGFSTLYAHNNSIHVYTGQYVGKGQSIAKMGRSGRATGDHLHYEIRIGNKAVNPFPYLSKK